MDALLRPMGHAHYLINTTHYITTTTHRLSGGIKTGVVIGLTVLIATTAGCFGQGPQPQPAPQSPPETVVLVESESPNLPPNPDGGIEMIPVEPTNSTQGVKWVAECYYDSDCYGVFGWLDACEFERCVSGNCQIDSAANLTPCDDGDVCTLDDRCWNGACIADGGIVDCDDGNPCTADFCEPWGGCSYTVLAGGCNDGDGCTQNDFCDGGVCVSGIDVCYQTGDCCDDHGGVGCLDPWIESCVCNADSYCCDVAWDSQCAQEVVEFGCGDCGIAVVIPTGDCCEPHGGYGCLDPWVESCVCDYDPYCCDTAWDSQCVDIAVTEGCADCGVVVVPPPPPAPTGPVGCFGFCGDQSPDGCFCDEQCAAYGDCCPDLCDSCFTTAQCGPSCLDVQPGPGCGDAACEDCVCSADSYCCATAWDEVCVELVTTLDCWMCE